MKILVANLGSTSLKYRLYEFTDGAERMLARGGIERVTDYPSAIETCLAELKQGGWFKDESELAAVGFKPIIARGVTGCVEMDARVLEAMEVYNGIAPAHNPPYVNGVRLFAKRMPRTPMIGLFETAFYQWAPEPAMRYAVPEPWYAAGVRRWGFHGASHKFIAERSAELLGREDVARRARNLYVDGGKTAVNQPELRVISCHLGGSASVTAIRNGVGVGCSLGMSPQSGLPHNNRVGDLDSAALPFMMRSAGLSLDEAERQLAKESGLKGISGGFNDVRDLDIQSGKGNEKARLALEVFVYEIRRWVGGYFFEMGGAEAIVFTAGIGENQTDLRTRVCAGLETLGIRLEVEANRAAVGGREAEIGAKGSRVRIFVIPTNEELVVAREARRYLQSHN